MRDPCLDGGERVACQCPSRMARQREVLEKVGLPQRIQAVFGRSVFRPHRCKKLSATLQIHAERSRSSQVAWL